MTFVEWMPMNLQNYLVVVGFYNPRRKQPSDWSRAAVYTDDEEIVLFLLLLDFLRLPTWCHMILWES